MRSSLHWLVGFGALLLLCGNSARTPTSGGSHDPRTASAHGYFFVGGTYAGTRDSQVMDGQMFVERIAPAHAAKHFPIVMISGAGQTAVNWMGTPDGREGWAQYFVSQGYVVYLVDQPARGRSAWHENLDGKVRSFDAQTVETLLTAPEHDERWPQAKLHTQWPGTGNDRGRSGDPVFDQFYASQVPFLADVAETETLMQRAGAALLDRIGPAILMTHSQSGPFGWLLADARPHLVKAIVALEPAGPAFRDEVNDHAPARPWGLTSIPMTYDPPASAPTQLDIEEQSGPVAPGRVRCLLQRAPARTWPNLRRLPVMLVTSEASYHAVYDHCTAQYLSQAGVPVDHYRLEAHGLRGNGHMMMLEKNNLQIAERIAAWLSRNVEQDVTAGAHSKTRSNHEAGNDE